MTDPWMWQGYPYLNVGGSVSWLVGLSTSIGLWAVWVISHLKDKETT